MSDIKKQVRDAHRDLIEARRAWREAKKALFSGQLRFPADYRAAILSAETLYEAARTMDEARKEYERLALLAVEGVAK